jgi:primase-polymerase (primpol)-like protein
VWYNIIEKKYSSDGVFMTNIETLKKLPEITNLKAWAVFVHSEQTKEGRWRKPPINPLTGSLAKPNDRSTCVSFMEAVQNLHGQDFLGRKYQGLSFMVGEGILGVDLDDCIVDGVIAPYAAKIIDKLNSYTEISPSGNGVRILGKADIPIHKACKKPEVEMYSYNKFLTMTGNVYQEFKPIRDITAEILELIAQYFPQTEKSTNKITSNFTACNLTDDEIIHKLISEQSGVGKALFYNTALRTTESENDLALCNKIAFYTQDPIQIKRIFEKSTLYSQKDDVHLRKWRNTNYAERTIEKALSSLSKTYDGKSFIPRDLLDTNRKTDGSIFINKTENGNCVMIIHKNGKKIFDRKSTLSEDENDYKHIQHLLCVYTDYKKSKGERVEGYYKLMSNLKVSKSEFTELKKQFSFIATSNLVFNFKNIGR